MFLSASERNIRAQAAGGLANDSLEKYSGILKDDGK